MRSQTEQKHRVTSIRTTEDQYQRIKKQADEKKMTVSNYLATVGEHGNGLTPEVMVRLQNIVSEANAAVQEYAPERNQKMQKEVNQLWSLLK
ncbi:MAG: hypothetical protein E7496_10535 [Ruminococcus sp.]|nr:hypothetical protein [Ruminococcus sp.]